MGMISKIPGMARLSSRLRTGSPDSIASAASESAPAATTATAAVFTEQDDARSLQLGQLQSHFANRFIMSAQTASEVLATVNWDLQLAIRRVTEAVANEGGTLLPIDPSVQLLGAVNVDGTSCYIDSLLFALFAAQSHFDPLLHTLSETEDTTIQGLKRALRAFVNRLRSGSLIGASIVNDLRNALALCGWHGGTSTSPSKTTQEDAGELLLFLLDKLGMPTVPFNVRFVHEASSEILRPEDPVPAYSEASSCQAHLSKSCASPSTDSDEKIVGERILSLSLASDANPDAPLMLEELIEAYFSSTHIQGLRRTVHANGTCKDITVDALALLELMPFYTAAATPATTEPQEKTNFATFEDRRLALPISLKRYAMDQNGCAIKNRRQVVVPEELDISNFVLQDTVSTADPSATAVSPRFILRLRAAVCHRGDSLHAGHYVAYVSALVKVDEQGTLAKHWLRFDDLDSGAGGHRVKVMPPGSGVVRAFSQINHDGYLLFYELCTEASNVVAPEGGLGPSETDITTHRRLYGQQPPELLSDAEIARQLQADEFVKAEQQESSWPQWRQ